MRLWSDEDCAQNTHYENTPININSTLCAGYVSGIISGCKVHINLSYIKLGTVEFHWLELNGVWQNQLHFPGVLSIWVEHITSWNELFPLYTISIYQVRQLVYCSDRLQIICEFDLTCLKNDFYFIVTLKYIGFNFSCINLLHCIPVYLDHLFDKFQPNWLKLTVNTYTVCYFRIQFEWLYIFYATQFITFVV